MTLVGETAADAMPSPWAHDGANVVVPYTPTIGPGYWRPAPPDLRPAAFVGRGQVTRLAVPGVVLHYTAWSQITDDIADVRIHGGVHLRFEQEAGARLGRHVGTHALQNTLRPARGR